MKASVNQMPLPLRVLFDRVGDSDSDFRCRVARAVDQKGGNSLLYLPLDKLIQSAAAPISDGQAASNGDQPAISPTVANEIAAGLPRVRELLRGRDREAR